MNPVNASSLPCVDDTPEEISRIVEEARVRAGLYTISRALRRVINLIGLAWVGEGAFQSPPNRP